MPEFPQARMQCRYQKTGRDRASAAKGGSRAEGVVIDAREWAAQYLAMSQICVDRLWRYPVKSMQGEAVDELVLGSAGVVADRGYGFFDVETGRLVSAKHPKRFGGLLGCSARYLSDPAPGEPTPPIEVTFPDGSVVRDDDVELARRVGALLGRHVRLITTVEEGLAFDEIDPQIDGVMPEEFMAALSPDSADTEHVLQIPVGMAAPGTMLDLAALHIVTTGTLGRLVAEYPAGEWDPRRLRPNMVIDAGPETLGDEDDWFGCDLHLGDDAVIHVVGPTPRCVMTTLAQPGLRRDPGVLKAIAGIGRKHIGTLGQFACAGSYAEVVSPGVLRRGDAVTVERVQPREGALAATITMMSAAMAAGN